MRIYKNDDGNVFTVLFSKAYPNGGDIAEAAREYIRRQKKAGLTDFIQNAGGQLSFSPSKTVETLGDHVMALIANGKEPDISRKGTWFGVYMDYVYEKGIDIYGIMLEECRKVGLTSWLSFRMNDVHDGDVIRSAFTANAYEKGYSRASYRDKVDYFDKALDFRHEFVRDWVYDYIVEQVEQYDTDGVELDFAREGTLFERGKEELGRPIMQAYYRKIRDFLDTVAVKRGHPILLSIRTFTDPVADYRSGVDAVQAARDGIFDMVVPSSRFFSTDDALPVAIWRRLLPENCRLAVDVEQLCRSSIDRNFSNVTLEQLYGYVYGYLSEGADDVYLFNDAYGYTIDEPGRAERMATLGSRENLKAARRRHTMGYCEFTAAGEALPDNRLPCRLIRNEYSGNIYCDLRFYVGETDTDMYLLLGIDAEAENLSVYVNTLRPAYVGKTKVEDAFSETPVLVYRVPAVKGNVRALEVAPKDGKNPTIVFAEMRNYQPEIIG